MLTHNGWRWVVGRRLKQESVQIEPEPNLQKSFNFRYRVRLQPNACCVQKFIHSQFLQLLVL